MIRTSFFLQRHPQSGTIYFRRAIPKRHRQSFNGKAEIKKSLQTYDKNIATIRATMLNARLESKFNQLEVDMGDNPFLSKITIDELDVKSGTVKSLDIDYGGDVEKELQALHEVNKLLSQSVRYISHCWTTVLPFILFKNYLG